MQLDMHFHATHAIALLAGLPKDDALTVATAAEFVDSADADNSGKNHDNEMLFAICTAHHPKDVPVVNLFHKEIHRIVWVPFHFLPGGVGNNLEEKLQCVKNSKIANQMFRHHIEQSDKAYYWHLLGIACHVYLDTFSHYGFSGIPSKMNEVSAGSFEFDDKTGKNILDYVKGKAARFCEKYKGEIAEFGSDGLGHGAVATYPDRPFLTWRFNYEQPRGGSVDSGWRNNPETFLEGLENLYHHLVKVAEKEGHKPLHDFSDMKDEIEEILKTEADKEGRCDRWKKFIQDRLKADSEYRGDDWSKEKDEFENVTPFKGKGDCYKFNQAAAIHRWYVMKDLLPEHEIYCA